MLRPGAAVLRAFRRGLDIRGRATRAEYWWVQLFYVLVSFAAFFLEESIQPDWVVALGLGPLTLAAYLLFFLPLATVGMRRFQDRGITGLAYLPFVASEFVPPDWIEAGTFWLLSQVNGSIADFGLGASSIDPRLAALIVVVTAMVTVATLVLCALPSEPRTNRWGPVPGRPEPASVFD